MEMIPGVVMLNNKALDMEKGEKELEKVKAIIYSMTIKEREKSSHL